MSILFLPYLDYFWMLFDPFKAVIQGILFSFTLRQLSGHIYNPIELPPRELMGPEAGEEDSDRDSGNEEEAVEAAAPPGQAAAGAAAQAEGEARGEAAPYYDLSV